MKGPLMDNVGIEGGGRGRGNSRALWVVAGLSLIISLVSLSANAVLLYRLMTVRQQAVDGLDSAIAALDGLGGDGFHYEYHLEQTIPFAVDIPFRRDLTIPFEADVPFQQDLTIPFQGNIPFQTTIQFPIDAGMLGTYTIDVPIDTSVYVDTSVPFHLDETFHVETSVPVHVDEAFHVETSVPVSLTIPIDIQADDPAVQGLVDQIRGWLLQLRASF
ncbi:hypothetical protein ACFLYD_04830 [Chloroflexota bacterium]